MHKWGWTRWRRGGWKRYTLSPQMHQEYPKTQQVPEKTRWILAGLPDYWEEISGSIQNSVGQREEGMKEEGERRSRASGTSLHLGGKELKHQEDSRPPRPSTGTGRHLKGWGVELTNLSQSELREKSTQTSHAAAFHTSDRVVSPLASTEAGSWAMGIVNDPREGLFADCGGVSQMGWHGWRNRCEGMLLKEKLSGHKSRVPLPVEQSYLFSMLVPAGWAIEKDLSVSVVLECLDAQARGKLWKFWSILRPTLFSVYILGF